MKIYFFYFSCRADSKQFEIRQFKECFSEKEYFKKQVVWGIYIYKVYTRRSAMLQWLQNVCTQCLSDCKTYVSRRKKSFPKDGRHMQSCLLSPHKVVWKRTATKKSRLGLILYEAVWTGCDDSKSSIPCRVCRPWPQSPVFGPLIFKPYRSVEGCGSRAKV